MELNAIKYIQRRMIVKGQIRRYHAFSCWILGNHICDAYGKLSSTMEEIKGYYSEFEKEYGNENRI